ncbi:Sensor diguanylate cyclase, PAS domain-containing [Candidatus Sulfobium mesophilum]|uniref:Sensor diguanylate cyclase, PAS domain-containing n=1 Tax=Candidatus Sulfobium mesophilum TaxID=2016548 RepID=A0A2U3QG42_9BACT|nr:Sensor diguanylate cyclase, PAS domain-containing [Candidatus Sulfobium mesophilum]
MISVKEDFYKNILDNLYDGVYLVDLDRRITYWNKSAESLTGYRSSDIVGRYCWDNILMHVDLEGDSLCQGPCPLLRSMKEERMLEQEVYLRHKNGHRTPVLVRASPLRDARGQVIGAVEIFSDNTPRITLAQQVKELQKLALLDPLTGLGNRRYAELTMHAKLEERRRYDSRFGVLFLDIDFFKKINDTYGHETGDRVLQMVAKTLQNGIRSSDTVGRWGGEEFIAFIAHADDWALSSLANKLRRLVEKSNFYAEQQLINVTVSIGATVSKMGDTVEELVRRADQLMYKAKLSGRNRLVID